MSVSDLTNTTWLLNNTVQFDPASDNTHWYFINFTSNNNSFSLLYFQNVDEDYEEFYLEYRLTNNNYVDVYFGQYNPNYEMNVINSNYQEITITGGNDVTNSDLISWLEANAIQQGGGGGESSSTTKIGDLSIIKKHFGTLEITKEILNGVTIYSNVQSYSITTNITNGTYTGDSTITSTATITLSANSGYTLPSTISVSGATYTYDQSTGVVNLSSPTGNVNIIVSCVTITYPTKSQIILLNLDGNGNKRYRVLSNVSGTTYEIIWMPSANLDNFASSSFASSGNRYNGGGVDVALNTTFYNTLTQTAKSAIVDKTFTTNYYSGKTETLTRHIYAIIPTDINTYMGTAPNGLSTKNMLWENYTPYDYVMWTRMGNISVSGMAWTIVCSNSSSDDFYSTRYGASTTHSIRPAMQIDLSKITFTIEA